MKIRVALFTLLLAGLIPITAGAQLICDAPAPDPQNPRLSPFDSASTVVDGQPLKVCYGRPSLNERPMLGGILPFGSPWRLGANEATALHLSFDGHVAGVPVERGSYSLYVDLGESEWVVHVNAVAARWGVPIDESVTSKDVGTGIVPVETLDDSVELLTLSFEDVDGSTVNLVVEWQYSRVRIPIHQS